MTSIFETTLGPISPPEEPTHSPGYCFVHHFAHIKTASPQMYSYIIYRAILLIVKLCKCIVFCNFFSPLNLILLRFSHVVVVCGWIQSFFTAAYYSFVRLYYILFICPFKIDEHLGYFQLGATANSAAARCLFTAPQLQIHASLHFPFVRAVTRRF